MKTTLFALICLALASALPAETVKTKVDNPLYQAWPLVAGTKAQFARTTRISGGLPGAPDQVSNKTISYTLSKITPEELTIEVGPESFTIPAKIVPDAPGSPKLAGTEVVKIQGKAYPCKVYRYTTTSKAEFERDTQGMGAEVVVWITPLVAGGVVRRQMSLTIKASYFIEDTWAASTVGRKAPALPRNSLRGD